MSKIAKQDGPTILDRFREPFLGSESAVERPVTSDGLDRAALWRSYWSTGDRRFLVDLGVVSEGPE